MSSWILAWFIAGIILMLAEIVVPGAVLSFLGIAAICTGTLIYFEVITTWQEVVFCFMGISMFLLIVVRGLFLKIMPGDSTIQDTSELREVQGAIVEVTDDIRPESPGRVKYRDTTWDAQCDAHIRKGEKAMIREQVGNKLVVEPLN